MQMQMQPPPWPVRALSCVSRHTSVGSLVVEWLESGPEQQALSRNIFTSFTYALHPSLRKGTLSPYIHVQEGKAGCVLVIPFPDLPPCFGQAHF